MGDDVTLLDFAVDANGAALVKPMNDIASGTAILVQSNRSKICRVNVRNAWDNGIMVIQFQDPINFPSKYNFFSPENVVISDCQTENCGLGDHNGGRLGAGINIGSGTRVCVSNCIDKSSPQGFIVDENAGAECTLSACTAYYSGRDGFWIGGEALLSACKAVASGQQGFSFNPWLHQLRDPGQPFYKTSVRVVGCAAVDQPVNGFSIQSDNVFFTGCTAEGHSATLPSGQVVFGTGAGFLVISGNYAALDQPEIKNVTLTDCVARNFQDGYSEMSSNSKVRVVIQGGLFRENVATDLRIIGWRLATPGLSSTRYFNTDANREPGTPTNPIKAWTPKLNPGVSTLNSTGRPVNVYVLGGNTSHVLWYPEGDVKNYQFIANGTPTTIHLEPWESIQVDLQDNTKPAPQWVWIAC